MIQLQVTLVLWIFFVINNATDEFKESSPERNAEDPVYRYLLDVFFSFSPTRVSDPVLILCYAIFDIVLYPNS